MSEITQFNAAAFSSLSKASGHTFSQKRTVTFYEIELFEADYHYTVIDGARIPYRKGTVIVAKPGQTRNSKLHFRCRYIHLGLTDGILKGALDALPSCVRIADVETYRALFDEAATLFIDGGSLLPVYAMLYRLAAMLERDANLRLPECRSGDERSETLHTVSNYLEKHYDRKISLESLAALVNLHPRYLHRIFKAAYGKTPAAYLLHVRLSRAKHLLLNTDDRIGEIAAACGFDSQPYFSAVFARAVGISPTAFRSQYSKTV